jgi:hypothetical protein
MSGRAAAVGGLVAAILYCFAYGGARATHVLLHRVEYETDCTLLVVRVSGHRIVGDSFATSAFAPLRALEQAIWSLVPDSARVYPSPTTGCNE